MMRISRYCSCIEDFLLDSRLPADVEITGACSDSRAVRPGYLFCAMKGARMDGHDYIGSALKNGAAAILAEHDVALPAGVPLLLVKDAYKCLGLVAELSAGRPADNLKLVAVTGTNGKTSTAFLLRAIMRACGRKTGMIGTVEYDIGEASTVPADRTTPTPFMLQELLCKMRRNGLEYAAIEVSSHALEQGRLGTARCAAAVFTNLTQDHLDYHLSMENYFQAKKLLFSRHLADGAPAIVNCDDSYGRKLAAEIKDRPLFSYTFDWNPDATVLASKLRLSAGGSEFELLFRGSGRKWHVKTCLPGRYNAENAAGAACAAYALGLDEKEAMAALAETPGAPGRMQPVSVPAWRYSVYVDYAHTDDALRNALMCLKQLMPRRLLVVFGCGGDRDRTKRPLMGRAASELADILYVTSDNPRTEPPDEIIREILKGVAQDAACHAITDRREAIFKAIAEAGDGDIVLIAGKGHEDYQEVNGARQHFNDCEVASEAIAAFCK